MNVSQRDENKYGEEKNKVQSGALYLVATPIGNMSDISRRAEKVLTEVDFIAAEDTRNSGKLLSALGISKPLVSYYEHNKKVSGERIRDRLLAGESCALVTDAGSPAISDPGEDIVKLCVDNGITVYSVPGCCAAITALSISGLSTRRFVFEGFLPTVKSEIEARLTALKNEKSTLIIYEAPHRLKKTLSALLSAFGNRRISLCRELTKLNEEVIRTDINGAIELYTEKEPRGEYVLVIEGMDESTAKGNAFWSNMTVKEHIDYYVNRQGMKKMDAIKAVSKDRGVPKSEIYKETI